MEEASVGKDFSNDASGFCSVMLLNLWNWISKVRVLSRPKPASSSRMYHLKPVLRAAPAPVPST